MDTFCIKLSIVTLLSFSLSAAQGSAALKTIYLEDDCTEENNVSFPIVYHVGSTNSSNSSGILAVSRNNSYNPNLDCWIILRPPPTDGIILTIHIKNPEANPGKENITISDSIDVSLPCGFINDQNESRSYDSDGDLNIHLHNGSDFCLKSRKEFVFIYTAYSKTPCETFEFECPSGCISKTLICDGYNHCGDNSDQKNCGYLTDDCKNDREITSPIVYEVESPGRSYSSGILTVSRNNWYLNNLTCWIILRPPPNCGIIISISITDFYYSRCLTNLTIENSSSGASFTYCGQIDDQDELSSHYTDGDMNIYFRSRNDQYFEFDKGFTLTYTSYSKFPCASYEFKCPVGCISKSLTCDGHNHCGDRSDQQQCSTNDDEPKPISSSTNDVKLAVGIISGFIILGILGALLWKLLNCEKRPEVSPSGRRANATNSSPPVVEFYRHNFPDESQSVTITESNEPVTPPPSYDPPPLYETLKFGRSNPCYE